MSTIEIPTSVSSMIDMTTTLNHHKDMEVSSSARYIHCRHNHCIKCCVECNLHNNVSGHRMFIDRLAIMITILALLSLGLMATFMILSLANIYLFLASAISCPILFFVSTLIGSKLWTHKNRSWNLDNNKKDLLGSKRSQRANGGLDTLDVIKNHLKKVLKPQHSPPVPPMHSIDLAPTTQMTPPLPPPPPPPPPPPHFTQVMLEMTPTGHIENKNMMMVKNEEEDIVTPKLSS